MPEVKNAKTAMFGDDIIHLTVGEEVNKVVNKLQKSTDKCTISDEKCRVTWNEQKTIYINFINKNNPNNTVNETYETTTKYLRINLYGKLEQKNSYASNKKMY